MKRLIIVAAAALAAIAAGAVAAVASTDSPAVKSALATAKAATAQYHDVDAALAAGYVPVGACTEVPGLGAMGIHYLNPAFASDSVIDAAKPELLLYLPKPGGRLVLVGVEYFKADADQNLSTDGDRPTLAGVPFDGPMEGHEPGMPIHYDLHAWVWRHNPSGSLAQFNPKISC
jgi:hypothetical protein